MGSMCRKASLETSQGKKKKKKKHSDVVATLKLCAKHRDVVRGISVHADILNRGLLHEDIYLGSALISLYIRCGMPHDAQDVFDSLPCHDLATWNALIGGYARLGHGESALNCYERLRQQHEEKFSPNEVTLLCVLNACGGIGALCKGQEVHGEICRRGFLRTNALLCSALVDMYGKCGMLSLANEVFDQISDRNVVTWNALITGYAQHGHDEKAIMCFQQMKQEGFFPSDVTFVCILKACGNMGSDNTGIEIHAEISKLGLLKTNIVVGTSMVDMYAKCGILVKAQEIFDALVGRDVTSWNVLISGYAQHCYHEEALSLFEEMKKQGFSPDAMTTISILKSCGNIQAYQRGKDIHSEIMKDGSVGMNVLVGVALVDMYVKTGELHLAKGVFDEIKNHNAVSWNTMVGGYAKQGHGEEALVCFKQMLHEALSPDQVTCICTLKACGSIGALDKGKEIHVLILVEGLVKREPLVGIALLDMYAKCGEYAKAHEVFDQLHVRNVVAWNALMAGYAQFGKDSIVLKLLNRMVGEDVEPNTITFTTVLNACSNSGLVDKGEMFYDAMHRDYGIIPSKEQYTCMVDLFGRAGQLGKAIQVIQTMPSLDYLPMWTSLLDACRKWGDIRLGQFAFEYAMKLDENNSMGMYLCIHNMHTIDTTMPDNVNNIDAFRLNHGVLYEELQRWW